MWNSVTVMVATLLNAIEVDLGKLGADVVSVVGRTAQPASAAIWLFRSAVQR